MSYANSSLLLSSYDDSDCRLPYGKRVSSDASSDSWVLDTGISEELQRYGSSSPDFIAPTDAQFHIHRSISLEEVPWVHRNLPQPDVGLNKRSNVVEIPSDEFQLKHSRNDVKVPDTSDRHNNYNNSCIKNTKSNPLSYRPFTCNGDTSSGTNSKRRQTPQTGPLAFLQPRQQTNGQQVQVKTKIRSMWNNMKYGWRVKRDINLKIDSSICLLGRYYHAKCVDISHELAASKASCDKLKVTEAKERFKEDLRNRIWFTYRFNFPPIPGTDYSTDSGWGCMLRAGQMMMAQAFICHFLHRDWRWSVAPNDYGDKIHKLIIRWFGDSLSPRCPFSIHNLVVLGHKYGRKVGDWYGPTHVAHVLRKALISARRLSCKFNNICMYVAPDGIIFKQDVVDLCTSFFDLPSPTDVDSLNATVSQGKPLSKGIPNSIQSIDSSSSTKHSLSGSSVVGWASDTGGTIPTLTRHLSECREATESLTSSLEPSLEQYVDCDCASVGTCTIKQDWKSIVLFVSVRLGNEKVNRFYIPWLKSLLEYEHCIGIIGGRPKHAVYFIGWQDEKLIHLDPHFCQPTVDVEKEDFSEKSFHCTSVQTMPFSEMDPSCSIGFYFKTKEDFDSFPIKISEISPFENNVDYPPFAFVDGRRADAERADVVSDASFCVVSNSGRSFSKDEDEYILL